MTKQEKLNHKILEYGRLKQRQHQVSTRLGVLRAQIIRGLMDITANRGKEHVDYYGVREFDTHLRFKKSTPKPDPGALEQLLYEKGLWEECTRPQIDELLVEQAFIEGKLTDSDLRSINGGSEITPALTIEEANRIGLQGSDESSSTRQGSGALHDRAHSKDIEEVSGDTESVGETTGHTTTDVQE